MNKLIRIGLTAVATAGVIGMSLGTASAANAASGCVTSQFRQGSTGNCVKYIQQIQALPADGIFGPQTKQNIVNFQRSAGLVADGIVGANTWKYLCVPLDGPSWSTAQKNAGCRSLY
ncbi:peptidoglycan-binding domain-containing protein [Curtobacterium pusillum]|uniref:peptidoglycan-binding domain-containing protein n=1 Tax=Curtobacterium pusillum TaxID=69373 RepID=UPI001C307FDF|nr:peptidoglycan-binding protein [Curtobacterium pusillum]